MYIEKQCASRQDGPSNKIEMLLKDMTSLQHSHIQTAQVGIWAFTNSACTAKSLLTTHHYKSNKTIMCYTVTKDLSLKCT